jgi:sec-independent protein translocase protein TatC
MSEHNGGAQPPDSEQPLRFPDDPEHGLDPHVEPARPPALTPKYTPPPTAGSADDDDDDEEDGMLRMSFLEHLEELRSRIIKALVGAGVAFLLSMFFSIPIWAWVKEPLQYAVDQVKGEIIAITPMEQFTIIWMWVPLVAAIYLTAPWVLYQVWAFIAPGLYPRERRWAAPFIIITAGLFLLGGVFAYYVALRYALVFLLGLGATTGVKATISIDSYFSLFVNVILGISILFEMPVVVFFLTLLRITTPGFLMRNSRYAILGIVILAAVVTPTPDPVNLALFAVPMILLFFMGVFASYLLVLHREKQKFPWGAFFIWLGVIVLLTAATIAVAVLEYGYRLIPAWPFLTK